MKVLTHSAIWFKHDGDYIHAALLLHAAATAAVVLLLLLAS
jgi:hypothetical protein